MNLLRRTLPALLAPCLFLAVNAAAQPAYTLHSHDRKIEVRSAPPMHTVRRVVQRQILLRFTASIRIDQSTLDAM
jgi:hypothetical protein